MKMCKETILALGGDGDVARYLSECSALVRAFGEIRVGEQTKKLKNDFEVSFDDDWLVRWAAGKGYIQTVKILLGHKCVNPGANHDQALIAAVKHSHFEVVKLLLAASAKDGRINPNSRNCLAFRNAVADGHTEIVKLMLADERVSPGDESVSPNVNMITAVARGHNGIVALMLKDERFDPSYYNNYAIWAAVRHENIQALAMLLADERADPSAANNRAFVFAAEHGLVEIMKMLWAALSVRTTRIDKDCLPFIKAIIAYKDMFEIATTIVAVDGQKKSCTITVPRAIEQITIKFE